MPAWGDIVVDDELEALWVYVATRGGKQPLPDEAAALPAPPQTLTEGRLTVCLARNGGALSGWRHDGGSGLIIAYRRPWPRRWGWTWPLPGSNPNWMRKATRCARSTRFSRTGSAT